MRLRMTRLMLAAMICLGIGHALADAAVGQLPGAFSVSATKVVYFSKGNLQYQGSSGIWRFAPHQYDYIGNNVGNTAPSASQTEWMDLFGWGTSGWDNGERYAYQPYSTSVNYYDYGVKNPKTADETLTGEYANGDWGVYNSSQLGYGWRTLTRDEWGYLIYSRSTSGTVNGTSNALYTEARILTDGSGTEGLTYNICGVILFPDDFDGSASYGGVTWGTINNVSEWSTTCTTAGWEALEAAGCVFLPAAGGRVGTDVSSAGVYGIYWTSTASAVEYVDDLYIGPNTFSPGGNYRYLGRSVRLVLDMASVPAGTTSWQFDYNGAIKSFTAPCSGIYELKVWGAQGGQFIKAGGLGGYATCRTTLTQGETIYIYVGGKGGDGYVSSTGGAGGWNGGGAGGSGVGGYNGSAGGGGATHISKVNNQVIGSGSGQCASLAGTDYIIVAGGGGGASHPWTTPGSGGGTEGGKGTRCNGTDSYQENYSQTFYYSLERSYGANGGNGCAHSWACEGAGGGGGGFYGGTSNFPNSIFDSGLQDAGGCGGNSAYNSSLASNFSTTAGQREGNGKAQIVLLVSQDEIDAHVGKVIGADGKMYKTVAAAQNAGTTASGVIAYWGWAGSVESGNSTYRGIVISLADLKITWGSCPDHMYYCTSINHQCSTATPYCSSVGDALNAKNGIAATSSAYSRNGEANYHDAACVAYDYGTARPAGASRWAIPSLGQWQLIAQGLTGNSSSLTSGEDNPDYNFGNLNTKIAAAGGAILDWLFYWSSTETDASYVWCFNVGGITDGRNGSRVTFFANRSNDQYMHTRAFFAFEDAMDAVYTISYDANGGSGAPSAQTKDGGIDLNLSGIAPTRAGYLFKGWNTEADGSGTSYASGATFTGNADTTLYAQWGGYGSWADENGISGAMDVEDASGVPNAFRYVFDQPEGALDIIADVDIAGDSVVMTTPEVVNSEGFTVKYELDQVAANGEVLAEGAGSSSADSLGIDFSSVKSNAFFKVALVVESTGGTASKTKALSDTTIGVLAITNAPATSIIGVPWVALAGGGAISVSNLVHTANLTEGDTIKAYDSASGKYSAWELQPDRTWRPIKVVGGADESAADAFTIPRGAGVWLTRQHPEEPIYLVGQACTNKVETTLEVPEASGSQTWNLVASPKVEPVDVAQLLNSKESTDKVMVPTKGAPKNFIYVGGKWGYIDYQTDEKGFVHAKFVTDDTTVPAGTGFWYLNGDTQRNSLDWEE